MATSGSTFVAAANPVRMPAPRRLSIVNRTSAVSATRQEDPTGLGSTPSHNGALSRLSSHTAVTVVAGWSRAHCGARSWTDRLHKHAATPNQLTAARIVHPNSRTRTGSRSEGREQHAANGGYVNPKPKFGS